MSESPFYNTLTGSLDAKGLKFAVVVSRFNEPVTSKLLDGAKQALKEQGVDDEDVLIVSCPGAVEIPLICKELIAKKSVDGIVALGAVIRGETPHFDCVVNSVTQGITQLNVDHSTPISFGVITTEDSEQAFARCGGAKGNKGHEAALVAIEMVNVKKELAL